MAAKNGPPWDLGSETHPSVSLQQGFDALPYPGPVHNSNRRLSQVQAFFSLSWVEMVVLPRAPDCYGRMCAVIVVNRVRFAAFPAEDPMLKRLDLGVRNQDDLLPSRNSPRISTSWKPAIFERL